jgi:LysR family transcriptional regulator, glycine cleavage system transcriptional activator
MELLRARSAKAELMITAPPVFTARWLMPRLADFAQREPAVQLRVFASSKMVDAGALDSSALVGDLDLRSEQSEVEIHLGAGQYPGYRADRLFAVSMAVVINPQLKLKKPEDLASHTLLHDDAMDLVVGGANAWQRWLEAAGVADRVDASQGPHFSSNILSLEAASQKLGVALALHPLVDADIASGRLCEPFEHIHVEPRSAYYLVCPEVIAERPAVAAFRRWLLDQIK